MKRATNRWWVVIAAVAAVWWVRRRGDDLPAPNPHVQAAVLSDGFVAVFGEASGRRVYELDRRGGKQRVVPLRLDGDARVVGTRGGTAVGWQAGNKVKLGVLASSGDIEDVSTWGKKVVRLCDGAASNDRRFGVGWLEADGGVWLVHGPVEQGVRTEAIEVAADATTAKPSWCGIASADEDIALIFRDGRKLMMNLCTRRECKRHVTRVPVADNATLLAFGCARAACLFASRDNQGAIRILRVTENGRVASRAFAEAAPDTQMSIIGTSRQFAVSYVAADGLPTVSVLDLDLRVSVLSYFSDTDEAPSLAFGAELMLVATRQGLFHVIPLRDP